MTQESRRISLRNASRHRREYHADLYVNNVKVGYVERAQSGKGGGMGAGNYRAVVEGVVVGLGARLADVRSDLEAWVRDEQAMEHDAVWLRIARQE
jgi:hypothetical protein